MLWRTSRALSGHGKVKYQFMQCQYVKPTVTFDINFNKFIEPSSLHQRIVLVRKIPVPRDSGMETTRIHSEERTVVQDDGQGKGAGPLTSGYNIIITHLGMVILCGQLGRMEKCLERMRSGHL